MNFHVGQKVVFVGTGTYPAFRRLGMIVPVQGPVYMIRQIREDPFEPHRIGLLFYEIKNPPHRALSGYEPAFAWDEFRPVVERKTDISIFTKILKSKNLELVR